MTSRLITQDFRYSNTFKRFCCKHASLFKHSVPAIRHHINKLPLCGVAALDRHISYRLQVYTYDFNIVNTIIRVYIKCKVAQPLDSAAF